jgi:hypothetical protein
LPSLLAAVKNSLRSFVAANDHRLWTIGVGADRDVESALEHLSRYEFDEIAAGGGVLNPSMLRYVYLDIPGPAATPQLIVTARSVEGDWEGTPVFKERLLLRVVGVGEMKRWLSAGTPLPLSRRDS